jgi:hypothetical protein
MAELRSDTPTLENIFVATLRQLGEEIHAVPFPHLCFVQKCHPKRSRSDGRKDWEDSLSLVGHSVREKGARRTKFLAQKCRGVASAW